MPIRVADRGSWFSGAAVVLLRPDPRRYESGGFGRLSADFLAGGGENSALIRANNLSESEAIIDVWSTFT